MGAGCQRAIDPEEDGYLAPNCIQQSPGRDAEDPGWAECDEEEQVDASQVRRVLSSLGRTRCIGCSQKCLRPTEDKANVTAPEQPEVEEAEIVNRGTCQVPSSMLADMAAARTCVDPNKEVNIVVLRELQLPQLESAMPRILSLPGLSHCHSPMYAPATEPVQVTLNIYDIGMAPQVQLVNSCLHRLGTGLFHCGVEIYDVEWSYAATKTGDGSGVFCNLPRECELQHFREPVVLGKTRFSPKGVQQLIDVLSAAWPAGDYDVLTRNCCHFCNELCQKLGVGPVPERVLNLADASSCMVQAWDVLCCKAAADAGMACRPPSSLVSSSQPTTSATQTTSD